MSDFIFVVVRYKLDFLRHTRLVLYTWLISHSDASFEAKPVDVVMTEGQLRGCPHWQRETASNPVASSGERETGSPGEEEVSANSLDGR